MKELSERALLEEIVRREAAKKATASLKEQILGELFDRQIDFYNDKSRNKVVLGSRRAGKTEMWTRIAVVTAMERPRTLIRIWSSSRLRAKELLWANFRYLTGRHGIKCKYNDTELSITFENGAIIRVVGADKDQSAQKKRGDKTVLEIVLEVQSFGPFIRSLVEDVIEPSLLDEKGTICLEGTPGPVCAGFWFEVSGGEDVAKTWTSKDGWSVHRWTMLENPHLPHAREELERKKKQRGWADDNPTYLREWCGKWVNDLDALFYKFDLFRNTYDPSRIQPWGPGWSHVLGWDLGFRDDMAICIWGWHDDHPGLYEVFSWKKPGALANEVMEVIQLQETEKNLKFIEQVADTGGGGKMYVEEVMSRYSRKFTAAKKTEKYEHVRLYSDDLLVGRVKLRPGSPLQVEMSTLMRDPDWPDPDKPEAPPREDPRYPNHCCFVAGTLVDTEGGPLPIEQLQVGMRVWTREGLREVEKTAPTGVKPVMTRLGITGTHDHPIWTENRGWVRLDSLRNSDVVVTTGGKKKVRNLPPASKIDRNRLVYAVSVKQTHEYFANGVLVSNCDASLYSYRAAWHYIKPPEEVKAPAAGTIDWLKKSLGDLKKDSDPDYFVFEDSQYGHGAD